MSAAYYLIFACGVIALLYGLVTSRSVLAADAGSARMQEISHAVQVGAQAYLNRQYRTIAIVGIVILVILWVALGWRVALGYLIGALLSGAAGYIGMNVRCARTSARRRAARAGLPPGSRHFRAGEVTGSSSSASASSGRVYYCSCATVPGGLRQCWEAMVEPASAPRSFDLRSSRRRHL